MNPTTLLIIEAFLRYGPSTARAIAGLFQKESPTIEDWEKLFSTTEKSYEDYVAPVAGPGLAVGERVP